MTFGLFDSPTGPADEAWDGGGVERLRAEARLPIKHCDSCGGGTKLYRRKLNSGMARALIVLHRYRFDDRWVDLKRLDPLLVAQIQGDLSKLAHWGLAETRTGADPEKRDSGVWRITDDGAAFVSQASTVASHVFLRSPGNHIEGYEETRVDIKAALGRRFNYYELMAGR